MPYLTDFSIAPLSQKMEKPGKCPPLSSKAKQIECPEIETVAQACFHDGNCAEDKKCCSDGCNVKCLQPGPNPEPTTFVNSEGE